MNYTLRRSVSLLLFGFIIAAHAPAQRRARAANNVAAVTRDASFERIDTVIASAIGERRLPGAVVLVGQGASVLYRKAYGARAVQPAREAMTPETIFDLASLTKPIATATSVMILVERGLVRLNDSVTRFIPEMKGEGRDDITIEHLLTHTSGLRPDFDLREQWTGIDAARTRLYQETLRQPPGARFIYSDLGFITLGEVVRRVSGQPLDEFAARNIFRPLTMRDTGFHRFEPGTEAILNVEVQSRTAPTETRRGQASYLGGTGVVSSADLSHNTAAAHMLRGEVHDPTAHRMNGVAGHAGLFSSADDLARYCRMILNGSTLR